ncbi:hypothetical protein [Owenweeksia hongkongensis]|uniref:hypothetical protein n=1 Tax=Owenweeksia hongkongensis TaxID=253245 RepID=UPI003A92A894
MKYFLLIYLGLLSNDFSAQDFKLELEIKPSFEPILQIEVKNSDREGTLSLTFQSSNDSSVLPLEQKDISRLYQFLTNYSFPTRTSSNDEGVPVRHYENTVFVPEQNIVIIGRDTLLEDFSGLILGGDTLKASLGAFKADLKFDSVKRQYYRNIISKKVHTDGTTYVGRFETVQTKHDFEIYYARFSESDLKLMKIILEIISDAESPYYQYIEAHLKEISIDTKPH